MDARVILRDRAWALACCLIFLTAGFCLLLPRGPALTFVSDISQCALILLVFRSAFLNIRINEGRARLFWILLCLGFGLWFCAQAMWSYFEVVLRREVPNPFVGDILLILHLVPMMAALAVQPQAERDEQIVRVGSLDLALLLIWWIYLYVFFVIPWQFIWPDRAAYGLAFDGIDLLGHFVFLAGAAALWLGSKGLWRAIYAMLFSAGLAYAVGDMAASFAIDLGKYYTGSLYDLPLLVSMGWFVGVGSVPRLSRLSVELTSTSGEKREGWISTAATVTILSLPIMAAWALYISNAPGAVRNFRLLLTLGVMIVMGLLAWAKQHRLDRELVRANRNLREDSFTDLLTGAKNRRFLASTIEADIHQVFRSYARGLAPGAKRDRDLVFYVVDTDAFKQINDQYGHAVGDKVLLEIVRRISSAIRHSDALIRWGGDEFLVVSRYTDRNGASHLARRVLNALANEPFEIEGCISIRCTCSVGWAVFPWFVREPKYVGFEDVLQLADSALYEAKKAGKNQAVGMMPFREEPLPGPQGILSGKNGRLQEQLAARMITVSGPPAPDSADPVMPPHSLAATQQS